MTASRRAGAPHVPFCVPYTDRREIAMAARAIRSGWLTTGPLTARFEAQLGGLVGASHAVALNSCTAALHLSLLAAGVGPGDEVITSPYTFAATGETILYLGARPVFADIEPESLNLDPDRVEGALSRRTKAIVPVHIAGLPARLDAIGAVAARRRLPVIDDAAHGLGASIGGRPVGTLADMTCFSFYATKNLTTGEGGMVTTDDARAARRIRQLSLHGLSRDAWKRYARAGSWRYDIVEVGYKYNMTDVAAALGLVQLRKFPAMQRKRRRLAARYRRLLQGVDAIDLPCEIPGTVHAWHLFIVRLRPGVLRIGRDAFIDRLRDLGIGASVHFQPLHLHTHYRRTFGYRRGSYPITERESARAISLPLYPGLGDRQQDRVVEALLELVRRHRR